MKFGEHLKNYRNAHNLTQSELAEKLFISQKTVSGWENNGKIPGIVTIKNIIKITDIPFDELFEDL